MNEPTQIKIILQKFIVNECTNEETQIVLAYFRANKLTNEFPGPEDIEILLAELPEMSPEKADQIFDSILKRANDTNIKVLGAKKTPYLRYIAVAASLLLLLTIGLNYQNTNLIPNKELQIDPNAITLQVGEGAVQILTEGDKTEVRNAKGDIVGKQNGNIIAYDTKNDLDKLVYNTLHIPFGKRFELQLSDGTIVHLNSGSSLKFPVKFMGSGNRQVYLEGEAFFEVSKDKKHPFIVQANDLNIRVLGTHFNVSNYSEDAKTEVVLIEGSVGMYTSKSVFVAEKSTILKPGFKGSFNKKDSQIDTKAVLTDSYTSWIQGGLVFRNLSFKEISVKLERHYNIKIQNQNNKFANEKFNARFADVSIDKVLSYFNEIHALNYTIVNNEVHIK